MAFDCPVCGTEVSDAAPSCPECGSDERTGWSENTRYDGLDLPSEAYGEAPLKSHGRNRLLGILALFLLLLFIYRFVLG